LLVGGEVPDNHVQAQRTPEVRVRTLRLPRFRLLCISCVNFCPEVSLMTHVVDASLHPTIPIPWELMLTRKPFEQVEIEFRAFFEEAPAPGSFADSGHRMFGGTGCDNVKERIRYASRPDANSHQRGGEGHGLRWSAAD
jgi:hypothetical protein